MRPLPTDMIGNSVWCLEWRHLSKLASLYFFYWCASIARTVGCVWNDSETNETSRLRFTVISHTPGRSLFSHIHIVSKRNWDGACLMNLTQQSYLSFFILNLFHCVAESWWNMPFKGTRHGDAVAYVIVATLILLFSIMTSRGLNTYCDVTQCRNVLWIFITDKHKPHPLETMWRMW